MYHLDTQDPNKLQLPQSMDTYTSMDVELSCKTVQEVMAMQPAKRKELWQARRQKMLTEKIDYAKFLTWFIENYPSSAEQTQKADVAFWEKFK